MDQFTQGVRPALLILMGDGRTRVTHRLRERDEYSWLARATTREHEISVRTSAGRQPFAHREATPRRKSGPGGPWRGRGRRHSDSGDARAHCGCTRKPQARCATSTRLWMAAFCCSRVRRVDRVCPRVWHRARTHDGDGWHCAVNWPVHTRRYGWAGEATCVRSAARGGRVCTLARDAHHGRELLIRSLAKLHYRRHWCAGRTVRSHRLDRPAQGEVRDPRSGAGISRQACRPTAGYTGNHRGNRKCWAPPGCLRQHIRLFHGSRSGARRILLAGG